MRLSKPLAFMFTFTLKGKDLTKDEAAALVQAASGDAIKIDLASVLNLRKIDSTKLFKLSVEKKLPELASLAWKISVSETPEIVKNSKSDLEIVAVQKPVDKLLDELHKTTGLWATGAAMILSSCGNGSWWTLRQIACYWVNDLAEVDPRSILFQGFEKLNSVWEPIDYRNGVDRRKTFHVSPVYISLRESLNWLLENDLVERQKHVSRGGRGESTSPQVQAMSRPYYTVQLTKRGIQLSEMWGDIEEFIQSSFESRLR